MITRILIIFTLIFSTTSFAVKKAIYGEDNRRSYDDHRVSKNARFMSMAVALQVKARQITPIEGLESFSSIRGIPLSIKKNICKDEVQPFSHELAVGECTGFLVGEDLLVTAGHCVSYKFKCSGYHWVFGITDSSSKTKEITVKNDNIYKCKEVIAMQNDGRNFIDYALIKLDRKVAYKEPLKIRKDGLADLNDDVFIIGHPNGISLKISDAAYVRKLADFYFETNLDSFFGNSGSPVINERTGLVEGVLVNGEDDFVFDKQKNCNRYKRCEMDQCRGEKASFISLNPLLAPSMKEYWSSLQKSK